MHSGIMPFHGVHPAQETNQNASALFVSYTISFSRILQFVQREDATGCKHRYVPVISEVPTLAADAKGVEAH